MIMNPRHLAIDMQASLEIVPICPFVQVGVSERQPLPAKDQLFTYCAG
jgi:hypothetical protein